jgi:hypothetical protein
MMHRRPFATRSLPLAVLTLLFAFCLLPAALGQSTSATLSGTVEDERGAVIPSVTVTAVNKGTQLSRDAVTNDQGYFTIPLLPPGTYTLKAHAQGFAPVEFPNVVLNVGDQKALQIQLKAGDINATVQVINEAPLIDESPAVGTTVDRQFVANLPLNGRSFQSLIALTPGVVLTKSNFSEQGQFSVNGQRANANYFSVDGVSANIAVSPANTVGQGGAGSLPGLSVTGGTNNLVSIDALQEFKIQTSTYAPEFGRTPGAQVSIVTSSGTNRFSGTLFEYFRNDALDANDWFANSRRLPKPALRQNDFGGVLGGPIIKNQTFFFFSFEGLRLRLPQTRILPVPSVVARQSAPAQIKPLLNAFPVPNGRDLGDGLAEFSASYSEPSTLNATSIRIDHTVSNKLTLFGRYNYAPSENVQRGVAVGPNTSLSVLFPAQINTQTATAGATWAMTSSVSNDFRINYSRNRGSSYVFLDDFGGAISPDDSTLFPSFATPKDARMGFTLGPIGFTTGRVNDNLQRQLNLVNSLSVVTGSHQSKLGVDYRTLSPFYGPRSYDQSVFFDDVPQALTGAPSFYFLVRITPLGIQITNFSAFAQDTWKVARRLTLTYGLRWEVNPPPHGRNDKELFTVDGLDNPSTLTLAAPGTPLYETTYNNFAPRIGVAYQLSQRQGRETVLRGAYGIFYDLGYGQIAETALSFPYVGFKLVSNQPYPLPLALAAPPPFTTNPPVFSFRASDRNLKLPRTHQWNVGIEQSLGSHQSVSASYVAAAGRRLLRQEIITNPNPNFSSVLATRNSATSDYRSVQLQFQRRLSRGLQALASYTFSKSSDNASDDSFFNVPSLMINLRQERGPSSFDVRHSFNAAVTYNLPAPDVGAVANSILRNWAVDTIFTARSATPVNVFTGLDVFGIGFFGGQSARPDLIPGVPLYLDNPNVAGGRRINPAAFDAATPGAARRQGTLGRNALRGFPVNQVDFSLRRQFNLTERVNLQFRAEFFNLFNHPNFADPINDLRSPFFGQSTSMLGRGLGSGGTSGGFNPLYQIGGPRSIQFALKLQF